MHNHIKCKRPIAFFAWAALVCTVLSSAASFLVYDYDDLIFHFPDMVSLVLLLLDLAPCVLLVLYIGKFHGQYKGAVLYPIICGLIALYPLLTTLRYIMQAYPWESVILELVLIVPFALLTVQAARGLRRKGYTIAAASVGIALQILRAIAMYTAMEWYITITHYLYPLRSFVGIIGNIFLYLALLLFGLNNRLPVLLETGKGRAKEMSPEQALRLLNDKLELGIITEETYREQRAEIIRRL